MSLRYNTENEDNSQNISTSNVINNKKDISKIAWWRYPVSILAFVGVYFLGPVLIGLLFSLLNFITPEFYKSSHLWIFIASDFWSAIIGFEIVDSIMMKKQYVFQAVWASIVSAYSFFVAIFNWVLGSTNLEQFLGVLTMGVIGIVYVGLSCMKNNGLKNKGSE